jgi:hypothetical protein
MKIIRTESLSNFIEIVKNESWEEVFSQGDVNKSFNSFLHLFLIHFESCFPMQHITSKTKILVGLQKESWYLVNGKEVYIFCQWLAIAPN